MAAKTVSAGELAKHTTSESAWVAIHGNVYDVTDWMHHHPGGDFVFEQVCWAHFLASIGLFLSPWFCLALISYQLFFF